jgi:hypothetical protein
MCYQRALKEDNQLAMFVLKAFPSFGGTTSTPTSR